MDEEVGETLFRATSDSTSYVVELCQSEAVCVVHDECVDVGHIDTRFDDGGADENVVFAMLERGHDLFKLTLWHLTVADRERGLRDELPQPTADAFDAFDAIVEEERLPASIEFTQYGFADQVVARLRYECADGQGAPRVRFPCCSCRGCRRSTYKGCAGSESPTA